MRSRIVVLVLLLAAFVGPPIIDEYKSRAQAPYNFGLSLQSRGYTDAAIKQFNEALRRNPRDTMSLVARASAYWAKHDVEAATADLDAAIRLEPTYTEAYVFRSDIERWAKGDIDHAIEDARKALSLDPSYIPAMRSLAAAEAMQEFPP